MNLQHKLKGDRELETKSGIITAILFKGQFGFIRQEDGSDIFFHRAGVLKPEFNELREGMPVDYLATTSPKGSRAIGVVAI